MKIKLFTAFISLVCCVTLLQSCNSEEEVIPQKPKEEIPYWEYFKGEINGSNISLENKLHNEPIQSSRSAYYFSGDWDVMPDSINIIGTLIRYNGDSELKITLYDLTPGERDLTLSANTYWYESCIDVTVFSDPLKKAIKAHYIPSEKNPFKVKITDVLWVSKTEPIIEVYLDGVLYNKENPDDIMIIKGSYGTR